MAALQVDAKGVRQPCPRCAKVNRIPFAKLGQTARCGSCQAEIGGAIDAPADVRDEA
ncbi:hypothetical protein PPSIR1_18000, partial [Plesiocystis pacifica SIR-1]